MSVAAISLRAPRKEDAHWIATQISRPEVQCMLTAPPHPYRLADAQYWIERQTEETFSFIVELAGKGQVGVVTILDRDEGPELGYWLQPEFWGKGVMTQAAGQCLNSYFEYSDDKVLSGYILGNTGSARVLQKLGFIDTHRSQRRCNFRDADVDLQRMELPAAIWRRLSEKAHSRIATSNKSEMDPEQ